MGGPQSARGRGQPGRFLLVVLIAAACVFYCAAEKKLVYDVRFAVFSSSPVPASGMLGQVLLKQMPPVMQAHAPLAQEYLSSTGAVPREPEQPALKLQADWLSFSGDAFSAAVREASKHALADSLEGHVQGVFPLFSLHLTLAKESDSSINGIVPPPLDVSAPLSLLRRPEGPSLTTCGDSPFVLALHLSPFLVPFSASIHQLQQPERQFSGDALSPVSPGLSSIPMSNVTPHRLVSSCSFSNAHTSRNGEQLLSRAETGALVPLLQVVLPPSNAGPGVPQFPAYFPAERAYHHAHGVQHTESSEHEAPPQPSFWRKYWWLILAALAMVTLMGGDTGQAQQAEQVSRRPGPGGTTRTREPSDRRR